MNSFSFRRDPKGKYLIFLKQNAPHVFWCGLTLVLMANNVAPHNIFWQWRVLVWTKLVAKSFRFWPFVESKEAKCWEFTNIVRPKRSSYWFSMFNRRFMKHPARFLGISHRPRLIRIWSLERTRKPNHKSGLCCILVAHSLLDRFVGSSMDAIALICLSSILAGESFWHPRELEKPMPGYLGWYIYWIYIIYRYRRSRTALDWISRPRMELLFFL